MRVAMLTREYPPDIYGGAGVHVANLVPAMRALVDVDVHCFGDPRADARGHGAAPDLAEANAALRTLSVDLAMTAAIDGVDAVHSHTWYTNLAGHLARLLHDVPHVITAHSLEPRRPWKADQLGGGYRVSSWVERTAYEHADAVVAVSEGMRADVLECYPALPPERVHVVHNGIDVDRYYPEPPEGSDAAAELLDRLGLDPAVPIVAFVGRITRQKGVAHLLGAAAHFDPEAQLLLCAGAPDTNQIADETADAVATLTAERPGVCWVRRMLTNDEIRQVLSAATVFVCPSVYEPLGIVNLEAMACGTAVVASAVGGIPEVVVAGETGLLVPHDEQDHPGFQRRLADAVNTLLRDPGRAAAMGRAGRERVMTHFSWQRAAARTVDIYRRLLAGEASTT